MINNKHIAYSISFDELYEGLLREVELGHVNRQVNGLLELFDYSMSCTMEKAWNVFTLSARGLIVCPSEKRIIACGMEKFFNYGETGLPDSVKALSYSVLEKMDGSCIFCYFYNEKWHCSTRGSFSSDQAIWAEKYLHEHIDLSLLNEETTYICEAIYPENRIVVKYDHDALYLLTAFDRLNGQEMGYEYILEKEAAGFKLPKLYEFSSIDEILTICKTLSYNEEGFVVRFSDGYRIKIKGDEYVRVHRLISNCKPINVWEILLAKDDIAVIKTQMPEEMHRDMDEIYNILNNKFYELLNSIKEVYEYTKHLSDKELGLSEVPHRSFVFAMRKNNLLEEAEKGNSKIRKSLFNVFYPKANILPGYTPSNVMNRFVQNDE